MMVPGDRTVNLLRQIVTPTERLQHCHHLRQNALQNLQILLIDPGGGGDLFHFCRGVFNALHMDRDPEKE